jgi:heme/copper-type cytochrome/quinol oxidase subunit 3
MSEPLAVSVARQRGRPVGWWGVLLLVATEAALFGAMIASYFYLRFQAVHWPPIGVPEPKVLAPTLLTLVLVCSSVPAAAAASAARRRQAGRASTALVTTAALAALYAAGTLVLLVQEWHDAPATKDAYDSLFFTIQGAHVAHVAAGVLVNLFLLATIARGRISQYRVNGIWAMSLYWHFVNALAVLVLLTTVSPAL